VVCYSLKILLSIQLLHHLLARRWQQSFSTVAYSFSLLQSLSPLTTGEAFHSSDIIVQQISYLTNDMTPSSTPLESRGLPAQASSSAKPVSSDNASPSPSQALPRLMLDGLDLAGANAPTNTVETNEHQQEEDAPDDDKQRQRELERLRAQLERSELNRSPLSAHRTNGPSFAQDSQAPSPEHGTTETPENLKSSQRSRRRVQWVGLTADDEFREPDHLSLRV
jgi:hypothetical protein